MPTDALVPESPWLRVDEGAAHAKVHKSQIFRACAKRQLEHVKVGGRRTILLKREWIDRWLESQCVHVLPAGVR